MPEVHTTTIDGKPATVLCAKCHKPIEEGDLRQVRTLGKEAFAKAIIRNYHKACA